MPYAVEMRLASRCRCVMVLPCPPISIYQRHMAPFQLCWCVPPIATTARRLCNGRGHSANNGYVCVLQDTRGRWDSGGDYYPLQGEGIDGYDTQEWIGRQPWRNAKLPPPAVPI